MLSVNMLKTDLPFIAMCIALIIVMMKLLDCLQLHFPLGFFFKCLENNAHKISPALAAQFIVCHHFTEYPHFDFFQCTGKIRTMMNQFRDTVGCIDLQFLMANTPRDRKSVV